ncbi:transport protein sec24c [Plakobranchus ocellatus]|uniref:Transport protein sec24c n=1 Tax=Plakobranchus ocellatus TaxID=259542 RepID=A0AAV3Y7T5_9GAST|nr:transport protein sec24c [Plakobranchus ocellatus]
MSSQFPYQGGHGGALPPNPNGGQFQPNSYNGTAPPLGSNHSAQPPLKGNPQMTQNGPPLGAPMGQFPPQGGQTSRPGFPPGFPPQIGNPRSFPPAQMPGGSANFQGAPPTSQFSNMSMNDHSRQMASSDIRQGMTAPLPSHTQQNINGFQPRHSGPPLTSNVPSGFPPTIGGGTPASVGPGMPPTSMRPGMPPSSVGAGMAPSTMNAGMPPSSMNAGMPPSSMNPGMPPSSMGAGMPPSSINAGMPPSSMGAGMPPPIGAGMPPSSVTSGMHPTSMGAGMPPSSLAGGMPPQLLKGGGSGPSNSMGNTRFPPSTVSGHIPPGPNAGAALLGQGMNQPLYPQPTGPIGQVPPVSQNQHFPGSAQGNQFGASPSMTPPQTQSMHPPPFSSIPARPGFPPMQSSGQMPPQPNQFQGSLPFNQQQPPPMGYGAPPGPQAPPAPMQPPQQKRLDPDQMPSPIQVIEDDKRTRSGVFQTNTRGNVPPLVTTNFTTQDQGNANPRFIRSTMYNVPCTADMLKSSHIPFALALSPFAELGPQEQPPPIVDLGELGPVRCKRCKAYMNPFMQFIDGGRRFQCVFCGAATDVPNEYFAHLDHTGRRVDSFNRAELCLGSYEFVATKDYCKNGVPPKEPAFIFMIDVSYNSVKSGLVNLICDKLKSEILINLPKETGATESEIRVGFVTYHKELHFYNVKGSLAQPQMMVVSDLEDMFVPLVDGFLVKLSESEAVIDSLLSQIPQMFAESKETELVLGPVIQAGLDALQSAERAGRLYIFHTGLPTAEAPGKMKNRDDRKLLGTEKEKTILSPQTSFYNKLGTECVSAGCSVELFLFPNQYIDVATMSDICRVTAGNIFKYSYFQADIDGERFIEDLKMTVLRSQAFDAILRVRTSTGIRPVDFYGNFYMANTTDVEMASVDSDSSVSLEIKHDDRLSESEGAYIQVAVLYTSVSGQRRLRCHNLSLNCCAQMADLFRSCELDVLINFFAKQAIRTCLNANPKQVREHIMNETAQILACYRKNCANPSSPGQLVLPECMKLLPLYANCVIKNDSISGGSEISTDDRSYLMHMVNSMDPQMSNVFFYPTLLPFHNLDMESNEIPTAIRCSVERLEDNGIYLLENGLSMFLWIGHNVKPEMIQSIFAVQSAAQVDIDKVQVLQLDNPVSRRLCDLISKLRERRSRYLKLTIVRQRDKLEPWFNHFLVEDKGMGSGSSYVDFLCHIHKEIRNILN